MSERVRIASGDSEASIDTLGAELVDWKIGGRELLWRADPAIWPKTSPVLFPIVGRVRDGRYRLGEKWFELGTHGFAAASIFEVERRTNDAVRLVLRDTDATRAAYPFAFQLAIEYRLSPSLIEIAIEVRNTGSGDLPYATGWHPGFALPFPGASPTGHVVEFDQEEARDVPEITSAGLFAPSLRTLDFDGRRLAITDDLMSREALCFLDAKSRSVKLVAPDGAAIRIDVDNFPHLALWSRDIGRYLCIEAWTGHGDPDGYDGDLFDKPSMRALSPGMAARHTAIASFSPAA